MTDEQTRAVRWGGRRGMDVLVDLPDLVQLGNRSGR
jgi:hypothetical protein